MYRADFTSAPFCYADFGSVRQPAYRNTVLSMHIAVSSYKSDSSKTYFPHHFCLFTNNKKKIKRRLKLIKPNGQCHEALKRKYNVFCKMYRHIIYAAR